MYVYIVSHSWDYVSKKKSLRNAFKEQNFFASSGTLKIAENYVLLKIMLILPLQKKPYELKLPQG